MTVCLIQDQPHWPANHDIKSFWLVYNRHNILIVKSGIVIPINDTKFCLIEAKLLLYIMPEGVASIKLFNMSIHGQIVKKRKDCHSNKKSYAWQRFPDEKTDCTAYQHHYLRENQWEDAILFIPEIGPSETAISFFCHDRFCCHRKHLSTSKSYSSLQFTTLLMEITIFNKELAFLYFICYTICDF